MKPKPTVGQTLFMLGLRGSKPQELKPVTVSSVGRKYFSVKHQGGYFSVEFRLSDWRQKSDLTAFWRIYESEQERLDESEHLKLRDKMRQTFDNYWHDVSLTKLRKIAAILDEKEPNET